ncbi:MAG: hypothetical protein RL398_2962 [Planctomycetota bacterium]|jgi:hypothetical protein
MKKTLLWLAFGSIVGFGIAWQVAQRIARLPLLPAHFELDGEPKSIDGVAVRSWQEANEVLKARAKLRMQYSYPDFFETVDGKQRLLPGRSEKSLDTFEVTYVPRSDGARGSGHVPRTVKVRCLMPATVDLGRTYPTPDFLRYEVEHAVDNE